MKQEEICLGQLWALRKTSGFSIPRGNLRTFYAHMKAGSILDLKLQLQGLLRVTCDLYFVILPFDKNRCYLFLTPKHRELGKIPGSTSLP